MEVLREISNQFRESGPIGLRGWVLTIGNPNHQGDSDSEEGTETIEEGTETIEEDRREVNVWNLTEDAEWELIPFPDHADEDALYIAKKDVTMRVRNKSTLMNRKSHGRNIYVPPGIFHHADRNVKLRYNFLRDCIEGSIARGHEVYMRYFMDIMSGLFGVRYWMEALKKSTYQQLIDREDGIDRDDERYLRLLDYLYLCQSAISCISSNGDDNDDEGWCQFEPSEMVMDRIMELIMDMITDVDDSIDIEEDIIRQSINNDSTKDYLINTVKDEMGINKVPAGTVKNPRFVRYGERFPDTNPTDEYLAAELRVKEEICIFYDLRDPDARYDQLPTENVPVPMSDGIELRDIIEMSRNEEEVKYRLDNLRLSLGIQLNMDTIMRAYNRRNNGQIDYDQLATCGIPVRDRGVEEFRYVDMDDNRNDHLETIGPSNSYGSFTDWNPLVIALVEDRIRNDIDGYIEIGVKSTRHSKFPQLSEMDRQTNDLMSCISRSYPNAVRAIHSNKFKIDKTHQSYILLMKSLQNSIEYEDSPRLRRLNLRNPEMRDYHRIDCDRLYDIMNLRKHSAYMTDNREWFVVVAGIVYRLIEDDGENGGKILIIVNDPRTMSVRLREYIGDIDVRIYDGDTTDDQVRESRIIMVNPKRVGNLPIYNWLGVFVENGHYIGKKTTKQSEYTRIHMNVSRNSMIISSKMTESNKSPDESLRRIFDAFGMMCRDNHLNVRRYCVARLLRGGHNIPFNNRATLILMRRIPENDTLAEEIRARYRDAEDKSELRHPELDVRDIDYGENNHHHLCLQLSPELPGSHAIVFVSSAKLGVSLACMSDDYQYYGKLIDIPDDYDGCAIVPLNDDTTSEVRCSKLERFRHFIFPGDIIMNNHIHTNMQQIGQLTPGYSVYSYRFNESYENYTSTEKFIHDVFVQHAEFYDVDQ